MKNTKKMEVKVPISNDEYIMLSNYCDKTESKYSEILKPMVLHGLDDFDHELSSTGSITLDVKHSLKCDEYIVLYLKFKSSEYCRLQSYAERVGMSCTKLVRYFILPTLNQHIE